MPDRYMYKEGMRLAKRLEEEEERAKAAGVDPRHPPTPVQQVLTPPPCSVVGRGTSAVEI